MEMKKLSKNKLLKTQSRKDLGSDILSLEIETN